VVRVPNKIRAACQWVRKPQDEWCLKEDLITALVNTQPHYFSVTISLYLYSFKLKN
jgi:hypothetical protein